MSMMGVSQVAGNVVGGYMTTFGTRVPFVAGASCAIAHAAVISLGLRETNTPALRAKAAEAKAARRGGGAGGGPSSGGSLRAAVLAVLRDPLAPPSPGR
jgi:hypothetical protein